MPTIRIGSRGVRAAVFRRARGRERRFRPRRCRLRRARRRHGGSRDEGRAPVVQLRQGPGRHPGCVRRRRLAGAARRGRVAELARDGEPRAGRGADGRGATGDPLARGAGRRVHARERRLPPRALRRRDAQTPAAGRRPHGPRDHDRAARLLPRLGGRGAAERTAGLARADRKRLARDLSAQEWRRAGDRGRRGRARRRRALLPRGRGAGRALDQPSRRYRRGDAPRTRPRRREPRPRRAPVPPERRGVAADDAGVLDPRDDARLRRHALELRGRRVHRPARPARRGLAGDLRRGLRGARHRDARRPSGGAARHDAHPRGRRRDLAPLHAAALPWRGGRTAARADPDLPGAPLPERRARDRRARGNDPARTLRLRRDRRRDARAQPDDGEQPARVHRLRPARGASRRGGGCVSTVAVDLRQTVEDAAAHLYVWALKDIPQDLRDALLDAQGRETSVPGRRVLDTIVKNVQVADSEGNLVCQDTGIAVYTCRVGEHFPLHPANIYSALKAGTERATLEHPLRSNAVHTITRENTGPNTGYRLPIVHWEFIPDWDGLDVKCVPKGSGSENMSFLKMCVPADGVRGIKHLVLESIGAAGGKPCPPGIVGVGIGGSADYAMYLAKEAIARPVGTRNADADVAKLEEELYDLLNETGIGPMGLGGDVTVLSCHVEHADTHMTLNPVAVNYQCWAARRASAHVAATGEVEFDREF